MKTTGSSPLRVACAGAGYFSRFHYDAWSRIHEVHVVGAMALTLEQAADTGHPAYTTITDLLAQTQPDLLDIITPPSTHLAFIRAAVAFGIKAIICQKPFCHSFEEAQAAVELCEEHAVMLIIHENFRFQPWFRCIKRALDDSLVGELQQITFRLRTGDGQGPDAYLDRQPYFQRMPRFLIHETGVHYLDTFRYLMGEPVAVYADLRTLNPAIQGEDAGHVILEFEGDKRALLDANRHLDHEAANCRTTFGECLVEGTQGTLTLTGNGEVTHRCFGQATTRQLLSPDISPGFAGDCVMALQQHAVTALLNGAQPENTGREYLQVLALEQAVYQSASHRQRIVFPTD